MSGRLVHAYVQRNVQNETKMAALVEGQQYGLSSQGNYSNKSFIFVKLTDSALRAIEEYQKLRANTSRHPAIHFDRNEGVINIPRPEAPSYHSFSFSLSNVEADVPQGSFECLQQTSSRSLDSLGCMIHKMQIHGTEDSYEKTKVKMADVEKQSKQNCTKVIKASGPYVGRKVKLHSSKTFPPKSSSSPPALYSAPTVKSIPKPLPAPSSGNHLTANNQVNFRASPVNNKLANQDIKRRSYRERIIHLLALRPYKKPELLARLMRDGIKDKDKKGLSAILCQVATLKDNTYSLARHCWSEVNEDWPFYSPEDRELLKRARPQNLTPPAEGEHHSPASIHSFSSSPPSQKRVLPGYDSEQPAKKQRISHFVRQEVNGSASKADSGLCSAKSDANSGSRREMLGFPKGDWDGSFRTDYSGHRSPLLDSGAPPRTAPDVNGWTNRLADSTLGRLSSDSNFLSKCREISRSKGGGIYASDLLHRDRYANNRPQITNGGSGSRGSTPQSSPDSRDSSDYRGGSCSLTSSPSSPEIPAYASKYMSISNGEQRARYKADFNAEYEEYRRLHSFIEQVSKRFASLEDMFRNCKEGTEEWHRVKNEIMREYEENKRVNFPDARRRFHYLHKKLSHIKRLISDYDQTQSRLQAVMS